jgi:hypothetical protein
MGWLKRGRFLNLEKKLKVFPYLSRAREKKLKVFLYHSHIRRVRWLQCLLKPQKNKRSSSSLRPNQPMSWLEKVWYPTREKKMGCCRYHTRNLKMSRKAKDLMFLIRVWNMIQARLRAQVLTN